MTMVRKQVYIRPDQEDRLKAAAAAGRVTEAEVIRRGIELALAGSAQTSAELRAAAYDRVEQQVSLSRSLRESPVAYVAERQIDSAWQTVLEMMARSSGRDPFAAPSSSRRPTSAKWDREEAYAERMARLLR